jgi:LmbE family N-acetylglucosaminyl deacetylase
MCNDVLGDRASAPRAVVAMLLLVAGLLGDDPCAAAAPPDESSAARLVNPGPDPRYKADILVVVAHPDDELLVATLLAKMSLDAHKRVAVVFCTHGENGENKAGYEQGQSLGAIREIEARTAVGTLGITNVWFLGGTDTPAPNGHDVLRSLATWNHGAVLGDLVRAVRLTRPAVILTFLPAPVIGESHEDHQAAGVIGTEAFDIAGDPTQFSEQVGFPVNHRGFSELLGGLRAWQPQKLYYFSDADDPSFLKGKGPSYPVTEVSATRRVEYFRLWLTMAHLYSTQYDNLPAADSDVPPGFDPPPVRLALGKSVVRTSLTSDILDGTSENAVAYTAPRGYHSGENVRSTIWVELGGAWSFYRQFWAAHDLKAVSDLIPVPAVEASGGRRLLVPLLLHNDTNKPQTVTLQASVPPGWSMDKPVEVHRIAAGDVVPISAEVLVGSGGSDEDLILAFSAIVGDKEVASTALRVHVRGSN